MKKINYWKGGDSLDFGCAGEVDLDWAGDGPDDLSHAHYSHTRGHSSSSSGSTSTVDSSLPPSPSLGSDPACPAPLPYNSRVPLTPRSAERKRRSDEVAAVDALNEYFVRVRLSRVNEDESVDQHAGRGSSGARHGSSGARHGSGLDGGLGIAFVDTGVSTYTPFTSSTYTPPPSAPSSTTTKRLSKQKPSHLVVPASPAPMSTSPVPDAEIPGALDELSLYFASTSPATSPVRLSFNALEIAKPLSTSIHSTSPSRYSYTSARSTSPQQQKRQPHLRSSSNPADELPSRTHRPKFASVGHIVFPVSAPTPDLSSPMYAERRVAYSWI